MPKTLSTVYVALFALLFAGAAMAAPAGQPVPDAEPVVVETEATEPASAEAAPAVNEPVIYGPLFQTPVEATPAHFEECGDVYCPPNFYCCNPLENLCVREGQVCIL